jgi:hypothetical protein
MGRSEEKSSPRPPFIEHTEVNRGGITVSGTVLDVPWACIFVSGGGNTDSRLASETITATWSRMSCADFTRILDHQ